MPLVECAHGRDEANGFVLTNTSRYLAGEFGFSCYNLHNDICISDSAKKCAKVQ